MEKALSAFFHGLKEKLPFSVIYAILFVIIMLYVLKLKETNDFLHGPEWICEKNIQSEEVIYKTDTKLKGGEMKISFRLEISYEDVIFYILEIQGLYDINQVSLCQDETEGARFCLIFDNQQKEKLEKFEEQLRCFLEENLEKNEKCNFDSEKLVIVQCQVAEIYYQFLNINRNDQMYVFFSDTEIRTITKKEFLMRCPHNSINIDEINLDESFYTNKKVMGIIADCIKAKG